MRNITVTVSDDTYHDARIWAARRDTSVSAVVQYLLDTLPTSSSSRAARAFSDADKPLVRKVLDPSANPLAS
jgi:hypothetical protein